jgi:GTP-binding protein Era
MPQNNEETFDTRCGFIAIVGRPNVGKSTLLNNMVGEKISITADKPQTTRHKIVGVKTVGDLQAIFIDTPGMHLRQKKAINKEMNKAAKSALIDVDAVIFVVEALEWNEEDSLVLDCVKDLRCPIFLLVNKVDTVKNKELLLPYLSELSVKLPTAELIPCSATKGTQVELIEQKVFAVLPEGPFYFPADQTSDKPLNFRLAEIIREKLTRSLSAELPYALTVEIEQVKQEETQLVIHAIIWVERDSQKGIVIGKKGEMLKKIGQEARLDMNHMLNTSVHLVLWVKVKEGWSDDNKALRNLGYLDLK